MLAIAPEKVAHVIVKAREYDVKVGAWEDGGSGIDAQSDSILEDYADDPTRREAAEFIAGLTERERANLVALAWVGRGSFSSEEFDEAVDTAREERRYRTADYLLGIPMLADFLEEGLNKMGISVEDAEGGIL